MAPAAGAGRPPGLHDHVHVHVLVIALYTHMADQGRRLMR
jgi:hypothetical protein